MTNPPTFTVEPTSQRGQSLFQWRTGPAFGQLHSLQMLTEIAEHLAGLAAREVQFARLIDETSAAGAYTDTVVADMATSMDLDADAVWGSIGEASTVFEAAKPRD